jgi:hypothetical protein
MKSEQVRRVAGGHSDTAVSAPIQVLTYYHMTICLLSILLAASFVCCFCLSYCNGFFAHVSSLSSIY